MIFLRLFQEEFKLNYKPKANEVKNNIEQKLSRQFGAAARDASREQMYKAVVQTVKDILTEKRSEFKDTINQKGEKRVYYMCMEFLMGRSLKTSLHNLGLADAYSKALSELGYDLNDLYECEPDAGLGNGGLGRLAACFMDSLSSLDYPACGFSLCYEYGLFKQKIIDGLQVELPDIWLPGGDAWLVPRQDKSCVVRFGGTGYRNSPRSKAPNAAFPEKRGNPASVPCTSVATGHPASSANRVTTAFVRRVR